MSGSRDTALKIARAYLAGKHCTLWGQTFDIITTPEQAAEWLADVLVEVVEVAETLDRPKNAPGGSASS